ncbi:MAG TPA: MerR family transcriptional regulator [Gallionella sp.]|nr:MerR family transcriptional regulator [Gallionella sp.]
MKPETTPCIDKSASTIYIGKLAELTGATPKAIRLYEEMGLIPSPARKGKYRVYTTKDVALIQMIRRAQTVGFNLAELKNLVALKAKNNQFPLAVANELIAKKREEFRIEMNRIALLDQQLLALLDELKQNFG